MYVHKRGREFTARGISGSCLNPRPTWFIQIACPGRVWRSLEIERANQIILRMVFYQWLPTLLRDFAYAPHQNRDHCIVLNRIFFRILLNWFSWIFNFLWILFYVLISSEIFHDLIASFALLPISCRKKKEKNRKKDIKKQKERQTGRKTERKKQEQSQGKANQRTKGPKYIHFHSIFEKSRVRAGFFKNSIWKNPSRPRDYPRDGTGRDETGFQLW